MSTIYIAGPMSSIPDLNFPEFHAVAAVLRAMGHTVMNPAEVNPDHGMAWADAMRADIPELCKCDTIFMLRGWRKSKGARLENYIAIELGMRVMDMDPVVQGEVVDAEIAA